MKEATKKLIKEPTAGFLWQIWGGFAAAATSVYPLILGIQADSNIWVTRVLPIVLLPCHAFWLVIALTVTYRYFKSRLANGPEILLTRYG